uniref:Uncharacterized protein n=1 Tax=Meloidogyne enterolobii TaxID=390850 RepID=A0A6V7VAQ9_MELEN|nr:unnamed protein product [Meloidogyne enterolobii]
MKFISVLIFLIFNSILWSLINSVKNNKNQNELSNVDETSNDLNKILNDGAESSVAPQIEKYRETLKPNTKITKKHKTENNKEEKRLKKNEYMKIYNQQHKKEKQVYNRNYLQNNKEKLQQDKKDYYQKNRDKYVQRVNKYNQNNKEKRREYKRKYYLKKKKEREILQNDRLKVGNIQPNNEGTSFVTPQNDDFIRNDNYAINKGKSPIECNENVQTDDCVNNLSDTNACPSGQPNVQSSVGLHTQQMDDHDDLIDLSLLDDSDFLDYLNSILNS